ncbi:sensor histidine kinase [Streptomyces specialis]|uniref:sensor histidine kinase n=1 Tax=Streptomyces specialis TaxID=498367 RepID=UPI00073EB401|nr:histidine kinase [Streptomyces specialis]
MLSSLRPHRHDVWIAAAGLAGGLLCVVFGLYTVVPDRPHGPAVLVGLAAMCGAELLRRTAPATAMALAVAALIVDAVTGGLLAVMIMFTDVVYAAVVYGSTRLSRAVVRGSGVVTVALTLAAVAWVGGGEGLLFGALCGGITTAPAWTGVIIRDHRATVAAERLRAEQTALLAEMDRVQAVTAERARMARELHDRVANHLSAIAIHSTAALSVEEPAAAREALKVIRENSTRGLAEMRGLIGLLRQQGDSAGVEATPGLDGPAGLDALLRRAVRDGAAGRLRFTGRDERPPGAALPVPVELAAYRIVQESLANAVKHAAPGEVTVVLRQEADVLTVTVTSPFHDRTPSRAPGSGAGLIGMRERVELLSGGFSAGPAMAEDGAPVWRVTAGLPLAERVLTS